MKSETTDSGKTYDNIFATLEFIKTSQRHIKTTKKKEE